MTQGLGKFLHEVAHALHSGPKLTDALEMAAMVQAAEDAPMVQPEHAEQELRNAWIEASMTLNRLNVQVGCVETFPDDPGSRARARTARHAAVDRLVTTIMRAVALHRALRQDEREDQS